MNYERESLKDWYEVLNENYKYINKDMNNLKIKREQIMNEQVKLNKINLLNSNLDNKYKTKKDIKNQTDVEFTLPEESKLILNRLNIKNYKTKNNLTGNAETLFLKDILERIDKINTKKIFKYKYKNTRTDSINLNEFNNNSTYKSNFLSSRNKKMDFGLLTNGQKDKKINWKNKNLLLSKTFNNFSQTKKDIDINRINFPKIKKRNRNKLLNKNNENKKSIIKMVLTEEDNSILRAKSINENILKLNKDFKKNKRLICGYNDKDEDYIIINNKKIYPLNLEKEINTKFKKNFFNIKKIEDIEKKLLNNKNDIFDKTKKNLVLKYQLKNKNRNENFYKHIDKNLLDY